MAETLRSLNSPRALLLGVGAAGLALSLTACGGDAAPVQGWVRSESYVTGHYQSYNKRVPVSKICEDDNLLGNKSHVTIDDGGEEGSNHSNKENENSTTKTRSTSKATEPPEENCTTIYKSVPTSRWVPAVYQLELNECADNGSNCQQTTVVVTQAEYYEYPVGSYYPESDSPKPTPQPSRSPAALPTMSFASPTN